MAACSGRPASSVSSAASIASGSRSVGERHAKRSGCRLPALVAITCSARLRIMLDQSLRKLRWVSLVAVVASFVGGLLMLHVGANGMVDAVVSYASRANAPDVGLKFTALIRVIESLDAFLVALALLIFSAGVFSLFIQDPEDAGASWMPAALRPRTLGDLMQTLAEIIVLVLSSSIWTKSFALKTGAAGSSCWGCPPESPCWPWDCV